MITKDQIHKAQKKWGDGIVKIGSLMNDEQACIKFTNSFLNSIYDFKNSDVLFKPTKANKEQFRPKIEMALSYFLGGKNSFCSEDEGFALKPWVEVIFENFGFIIEENRALVMGNYFFTDTTGSTLKVEYTFGYKLSNDKLVIDLHHSSLPFS
ncbi:MAG: hypothetical protein CBC30_06670 [Chloroflexi bacterium TMED70]|nr:MAG: hypothetical protein CBC30_06670 [Chloroflexi bacterium TMED70]